MSNKKYFNKRAKNILNAEQYKAMLFLTLFYKQKMWWIHRKTVILLHWLRLNFLSGLVQSLASFSVNHVSLVPPKLDIYVYDSKRISVAAYLFNRGWVVIPSLLASNKDIISPRKTLIASNYQVLEERKS